MACGLSAVEVMNAAGLLVRETGVQTESFFIGPASVSIPEEEEATFDNMASGHRSKHAYGSRTGTPSGNTRGAALLYSAGRL